MASLKFTVPALLLLFVGAYFMLFEQWANSLGTQWPPIDNKGPSRDLPCVGVGFDLTASYGTVALSFPNGTITALSKIAASPDYHEVLSRLSLESSTHPTPPYSNWDEELRDAPRQRVRQKRKASGLPASRDVAALSNMTSHLRTAAENHLRYRVTHVLISTPNLLALYDEDIQDTLEHVGLKSADVTMKVRSLWETISGYAGYGQGLCRDYRNITGCQEEQQSMSDEEIMAVLFTTTALTVSLSTVKSAYGLWEPPYRRITDFELGLKSRHENPNERYYWEAVKDRLREIMVENQYYKRPDKVLLFGEASGEEKFHDVLNESLSSVMEEMPPILDSQSLYAPAEGAAEFAKRGLWNQAHDQAWDTELDWLLAQEREGL